MRREAPQYVFFAANPSKIQAVRIEILEPSEASLANQFFELQESRMVLQQVSDHQPAIEAFRKRHQFFGLIESQGKWLFDENVLARFEGCFCKTVVQNGGRSNCDGGDGCIRQHILEARRCAAMGGAKYLCSRSILINDCRQRLECREVAHDVLAPMAGADYRNLWATKFSGMRSRRGKLYDRHS